MQQHRMQDMDLIFANCWLFNGGAQHSDVGGYGEQIAEIWQGQWVASGFASEYPSAQLPVSVHKCIRLGLAMTRMQAVTECHVHGHLAARCNQVHALPAFYASGWTNAFASAA